MLGFVRVAYQTLGRTQNIGMRYCAMIEAPKNQKSTITDFDTGEAPNIISVLLERPLI